jgi:hypothetical protein
MQKSVEIKRYSLARLTNFSGVRAVIFLFDESDNTIGRLEFRASSVPTQLNMSYGFPNLFYPIEAFADVVDILRNESPTYLVYEETIGYGRIITDAEAVGEGENATP